MGTESKGVLWVHISYYYLASLLGLVVLFFGLVNGLRGITTVVLPDGSPEVKQSVVGSTGSAAPAGRVAQPRQTARPTAQPTETPKDQAVGIAKDRGWREALQGLLVGLLGAAAFVWHLRQARRRERELTDNPAQRAAE